jgi:hypothetical protein
MPDIGSLRPLEVAESVFAQFFRSAMKRAASFSVVARKP